jgi:hypothetical protein
VDYDSASHETRTNAEHSETGSDFRVSFESLAAPASGDLYFIRVQDGPVKIGRSADVQKRLRMLQCACPYDLELVGVLRNGGACEATFHANLDEYRMRGEWFRWEGAVCAAVEAALHDGRWRTVFGFSEPADEDWWTGSPLYERAA